MLFKKAFSLCLHLPRKIQCQIFCRDMCHCLCFPHQHSLLAYTDCVYFSLNQYSVVSHFSEEFAQRTLSETLYIAPHTPTHGIPPLDDIVSSPFLGLLSVVILQPGVPNNATQ